MTNCLQTCADTNWSTSGTSENAKYIWNLQDCNAILINFAL